MTNPTAPTDIATTPDERADWRLSAFDKVPATVVYSPSPRREACVWHAFGSGHPNYQAAVARLTAQHYAVVPFTIPTSGDGTAA
jgi:hypothetical protein